MIQKAVAATLVAMILPSVAGAQGTTRETMFGMKTYYEPERVQREGDVVSFTLYRSGVPETPDEVGRFKINCQSRESVRIVNDQPTDPAKVLAGEELYPVGKKLCEWEKKGFFEKLAE